MISVSKINEIARATKECPRLTVNVFPDGTFLYGASENDIIARGDWKGDWIYRIFCIKYPMTRKQVKELLRGEL